MSVAAIAKADDWRSDAWPVEVEVAEVLDRYKDWKPALLELFGHASGCYKWAMLDRDQLQQWSRGPITLLGDAAHPVLPYLAQGAAMGIEDAYVLAALLQRSAGDFKSALMHYENVRKQRTSRVQLGARARSRENHAASPIHRIGRNLGYVRQRLVHPSETMYKVEWIHGYDPKAELG